MCCAIIEFDLPLITWCRWERSGCSPVNLRRRCWWTVSVGAPSCWPSCVSSRPSRRGWECGWFRPPRTRAPCTRNLQNRAFFWQNFIGFPQNAFSQKSTFKLTDFQVDFMWVWGAHDFLECSEWTCQLFSTCTLT